MKDALFEFGKPIPLRTIDDNLFSQNPYDGNVRGVLSKWGQMKDSGRVLIALPPIDHAPIEFPCRTLERNIDPEEVAEMIAKQKRDQSDEFVFPMMSLANLPNLDGSIGNDISCTLDENGFPKQKAVFTYRRCGLGIVAEDNKLEAAFWRTTNSIPPHGNPFSWLSMRMRNSGDITLPALPGRLLVLSQEQVQSNELSLKFNK